MLRVYYQYFRNLLLHLPVSGSSNSSATVQEVDEHHPNSVKSSLFDCLKGSKRSSQVQFQGVFNRRKRTLKQILCKLSSRDCAKQKLEDVVTGTWSIVMEKATVTTLLDYAQHNTNSFHNSPVRGGTRPWNCDSGGIRASLSDLTISVVSDTP